MRVKDAEAITGGLSEPGKMPGRAYNLPAWECNIGALLRLKAGSVCSGCYAMKGRYAMTQAKTAMMRRMEALKNPMWVEAMAYLINRYARTKGYTEFRWHDSGDLQGVWHLELIEAVCLLTPEVAHWLPTREYRVVKDYLKTHQKPDNLVIRVSAQYINQASGVSGLPCSTVSESEDVFPDAHHCPARHQGNSCGNCRACWDPEVEHVDYHVH